MRRGRVLVAGLTTLTLLALAGCNVGKPAGVDGDLTNNWPAFADAKTPTPVVGACYDTEYTDSWSGDFDSQTVDCSKQHWTETSYVGQFDGDLAKRTVPPLADSADLADAFATCTDKTTDYLGGPWQGGFTWLGMTLPGSAAWKGGARWYRCEVVGISHDLKADYVELTGSAKGAVAPGGTLARGCSTVTDDGSGSITADDAVDCSKPHNSEYSGTYTLTGSSWPGTDKIDTQASAACKKIMGTYLGTDQSQYFSWIWWEISESEWNLGIRSAACQILATAGKGTINKVRYTGSAKGIGKTKPTNWSTTG
jgi:Septum formation